MYYNNGNYNNYNNNYNHNNHNNNYNNNHKNNNHDKNKPETDFGPSPFVIDINKATLANDTYRTALWTGKNLQLTLMSINPGEDIGLEVHPDNDQFLRIEEGIGIVQMGSSCDNLSFQHNVYDDYAIFVPAGTWHNVTNTGKKAMKIYAIYAPPHHPHGTIHQTKAIAEMQEN